MKTIADQRGTVRVQTLMGAVILALFAGFIAGALYSSVKLKSVHRQGMGMLAPDTGENTVDHSEKIAGRIKDVKAHLRDHPDDAAAWAQLGNLFFDIAQIPDAIEAYEKSLVLEPDNIQVMTDLGVMYRRNQQPEKAVEVFDRVNTLKPEFETAWFNKGVVLLHDLDDQEEGIAAWKKLVEINPMAMAPNGESVAMLLQRLQKK